MINLLPESNKKELRAARANVTLLRYNVLTASAVVILLLIVGGFYAYLATTRAQAEATNSDNQAKAAEYSSTKNEATEYRRNLATAKQILDNQVDYSSLVFRITELLPKGVILDNVNLSAKDFGNQVTITAHAKDYTTASKLKENFEESKIFDNVFFQRIDATSTTGENTNYPVNVDISVKINKVTQ